MILAFLITATILIYNRNYDRFYEREYKRLVSHTVQFMLDEDSPPPTADVLRRRILRNVIIDLLFITKGQSIDPLFRIYELNGFYQHDLSLLRHGSWHKRLAALVRLDQWKSTAPLDEQTFLLDDPNKDVRIHAMKALSRTSDPGLAMNILNHLAASRIDVSIRFECLTRLLGHHRELLIGLLKNPDLNELAPFIIKVLGEKRDISSVPSILEAVRTGSTFLRESAYLALGKIGDPRSISFLLQGLESEKAGERVAALKALAEVDEDLLRENQSSLEADADPLVRAWTQHFLRAKAL